MRHVEFGESVTVTGRRAAARVRGFSMIEVLVSMALVSVAMLGAVLLQASSLKLSKGASFRTQAVLLSTEISERMEANKAGAIVGNYAIPVETSTPVTVPQDCVAATCDSSQLATYDLNQWGTRILAALPGSSWQIVLADNTNPVSYTILVKWQDRREKAAGVVAGQTTETFTLTSSKSVFQQ